MDPQHCFPYTRETLTNKQVRYIIKYVNYSFLIVRQIPISSHPFTLSSILLIHISSHHSTLPSILVHMKTHNFSVWKSGTITLFPLRMCRRIWRLTTEERRVRITSIRSSSHFGWTLNIMPLIKLNLITLFEANILKNTRDRCAVFSRMVRDINQQNYCLVDVL